MLFGHLRGAVETHFIPKTTAQQVAGGRLENATRQIPEGDLDATSRAHGGASDSARARALHQHFGVELVYIQRILTQKNPLHFVDDQILYAPAPISLSDAIQTSVGLNAYQVPVPCAAHNHALHIGDFHFLAKVGSLPGVCCRKEDKPRGLKEAPACITSHGLANRFRRAAA